MFPQTHCFRDDVELSPERVLADAAGGVNAE